MIWPHRKGGKQEEQLIREAKNKSESEEDFFFCIVRELPGNRKIVKVPRRRIAMEEKDGEKEEC